MSKFSEFLVKSAKIPPNFQGFDLYIADALIVRADKAIYPPTIRAANRYYSEEVLQIYGLRREFPFISLTGHPPLWAV